MELEQDGDSGSVRADVHNPIELQETAEENLTPPPMADEATEIGETVLPANPNEPESKISDDEPVASSSTAIHVDEKENISEALPLNEKPQSDEHIAKGTSESNVHLSTTQPEKILGETGVSHDSNIDTTGTIGGLSSDQNAQPPDDTVPDEDDFILVSQDEAPMELAEEYPSIEHNQKEGLTAPGNTELQQSSEAVSEDVIPANVNNSETTKEQEATQKNADKPEESAEIVDPQASPIIEVTKISTPEIPISTEQNELLNNPPPLPAEEISLESPTETIDESGGMPIPEEEEVAESEVSELEIISHHDAAMSTSEGTISEDQENERIEEATVDKVKETEPLNNVNEENTSPIEGSVQEESKPVPEALPELTHFVEENLCAGETQQVPETSETAAKNLAAETKIDVTEQAEMVSKPAEEKEAEPAASGDVDNHVEDSRTTPTMDVEPTVDMPVVPEPKFTPELSEIAEKLNVPPDAESDEEPTEKIVTQLDEVATDPIHTASEIAVVNESPVHDQEEMTNVTGSNIDTTASLDQTSDILENSEPAEAKEAIEEMAKSATNEKDDQIIFEDTDSTKAQALPLDQPGFSDEAVPASDEQPEVQAKVNLSAESDEVQPPEVNTKDSPSDDIPSDVAQEEQEKSESAELVEPPLEGEPPETALPTTELTHEHSNDDVERLQSGDSAHEIAENIAEPAKPSTQSTYPNTTIEQEDTFNTSTEESTAPVELVEKEIEESGPEEASEESSQEVAVSTTTAENENAGQEDISQANEPSRPEEETDKSEEVESPVVTKSEVVIPVSSHVAHDINPDSTSSFDSKEEDMTREFVETRSVFSADVSSSMTNNVLGEGPPEAVTSEAVVEPSVTFQAFARSVDPEPLSVIEDAGKSTVDEFQAQDLDVGSSQPPEATADLTANQEEIPTASQTKLENQTNETSTQISSEPIITFSADGPTESAVGDSHAEAKGSVSLEQPNEITSDQTKQPAVLGTSLEYPEIAEGLQVSELHQPNVREEPTIQMKEENDTPVKDYHSNELSAALNETSEQTQAEPSDLVEIAAPEIFSSLIDDKAIIHEAELKDKLDESVKNDIGEITSIPNLVTNKEENEANTLPIIAEVVEEQHNLSPPDDSLDDTQSELSRDLTPQVLDLKVTTGEPTIEEASELEPYLEEPKSSEPSVEPSKVDVPSDNEPNGDDATKSEIAEDIKESPEVVREGVATKIAIDEDTDVKINCVDEAGEDTQEDAEAVSTREHQVEREIPEKEMDEGAIEEPTTSEVISQELIDLGESEHATDELPATDEVETNEDDNVPDAAIIDTQPTEAEAVNSDLSEAKVEDIQLDELAGLTEPAPTEVATTTLSEHESQVHELLEETHNDDAPDSSAEPIAAEPIVEETDTPLHEQALEDETFPIADEEPHQATAEDEISEDFPEETVEQPLFDHEEVEPVAKESLAEANERHSTLQDKSLSPLEEHGEENVEEHVPETFLGSPEQHIPVEQSESALVDPASEHVSHQDKSPEIASEEPASPENHMEEETQNITEGTGEEEVAELMSEEVEKPTSAPVLEEQIQSDEKEEDGEEEEEYPVEEEEHPMEVVEPVVHTEAEDPHELDEEEMTAEDLGMDQAPIIEEREVEESTENVAESAEAPAVEPIEETVEEPEEEPIEEADGEPLEGQVEEPIQGAEDTEISVQEPVHQDVVEPVEETVEETEESMAEPALETITDHRDETAYQHPSEEQVPQSEDLAEDITREEESPTTMTAEESDMPSTVVDDAGQEAFEPLSAEVDSTVDKPEDVDETVQNAVAQEETVEIPDETAEEIHMEAPKETSEETPLSLQEFEDEAPEESLIEEESEPLEEPVSAAEEPIHEEEVTTDIEQESDAVNLLEEEQLDQTVYDEDLEGEELPREMGESTLEDNVDDLAVPEPDEDMEESALMEGTTDAHVHDIEEEDEMEDKELQGLEEEQPQDIPPEFEKDEHEDEDVEEPLATFAEDPEHPTDPEGVASESAVAPETLATEESDPIHQMHGAEEIIAAAVAAPILLETASGVYESEEPSVPNRSIEDDEVSQEPITTEVPDVAQEPPVETVLEEESAPIEEPLAISEEDESIPPIIAPEEELLNLATGEDANLTEEATEAPELTLHEASEASFIESNEAFGAEPSTTLDLTTIESKEGSMMMSEPVMVEESDTYSVADLAPFQPKEAIAPFDGHPDMHTKEDLIDALESPITPGYVEDSSIDSADLADSFEDAPEAPELLSKQGDLLEPVENVAGGFVEVSPPEDTEAPFADSKEISVEGDDAAAESASMEDTHDREEPVQDEDDWTIPPLRGYYSSRKGKSADYDTFSIREARVVAIPPVVNARTIVRLIPTEFPITPEPPSPSNNPYVHVYTSKSAAVDLPMPLFEPIRRHKKSTSSPLPSSTFPDTPPSPTLSFGSPSRMMGTRTPTRPPTSYSWLGKMFEPVGVEIVDAQEQGWIEEFEEPVEDLPTRKLSQRLKRKIFPHKEHEIIPEEDEQAKCVIM